MMVQQCLMNIQDAIQFATNDMVQLVNLNELQNEIIDKDLHEIKGYYI